MKPTKCKVVRVLLCLLSRNKHPLWLDALRGEAQREIERGFLPLRGEGGMIWSGDPPRSSSALPSAVIVPSIECALHQNWEKIPYAGFMKHTKL